ncbi:MAG: nucleotidyltransferase family protein [Clostridiales bacterium]|nr:nucleotidyltransferase family protein [Clostridiales bacterium]
MAAQRQKPIAAVIMASGFSRRMGRNKLALRLDGADIEAAPAAAPGPGGTVIEYMMDKVARVGYEPVIVVSQYDQILLWADERGFYPVINPYAAQGKSSSIRISLSVLEKLTAKGKFRPASGIIFFPGDQILLSGELLEELKMAFLARPDRIVFPSYDGKPGSPATFPADMLPRLKKLEGEEGGMAAAKEQPDRILLVPAEPAWQGMDVDTMEDWERARGLLAEKPTLHL